MRELDNAVQRALILQPGTVIAAAHLRLESGRGTPTRLEVVPATAPAPELPTRADAGLSGDLRMREFQVIVNTLRDVRGSRADAAQRLGISPRTLRYKLARMRESGFDPDIAQRA